VVSDVLAVVIGDHAVQHVEDGARTPEFRERTAYEKGAQRIDVEVRVNGFRRHVVQSRLRKMEALLMMQSMGPAMFCTREGSAAASARLDRFAWMAQARTPDPASSSASDSASRPERL